MIYHVPYPISESSRAASAIRPRAMRDAFIDAGYRVYEVSGDAARRRRRIRALMRRIALGETFDFCYSESSSLPTSLTESRHFPPHPFLDLVFLARLRRHGIPVGLFYRDIYWRDRAYVDSVGPVAAEGMRALYYWDLAWYRAGVDRLYLPSLAMGEVVPLVPRERHAALPPGLSPVDVATPDGNLHVFYVGGLGQHYRLDLLLAAVADVEGVELTVCVPSEQWQAHRDDLEPLLTPRVHVVHASGEELEELYARAHVCSLVVEPSAYRDFAVPLKLFEYLGHARPVLATASTLAGNMVEREDIGWTVTYDVEHLRETLTYLRDHPDERAAKSANARRVRASHTWQARAHQVARELTGSARA
ncbi:glycosyltransferase family protein [Nanchangia anserum]|nr:glycosyltransferase [Nanchangia anserum]